MHALLREASTVRDEPVESASSERGRDVCVESPYTKLAVSSTIDRGKALSYLHRTFVKDLPHVVCVFAALGVGEKGQWGGVSSVGAEDGLAQASSRLARCLAACLGQGIAEYGRDVDRLNGEAGV